MYFNKLREYIVNKECLIRHGKGVVIDGDDDRFDLLEYDTKGDEDFLSKIKRLIKSLRNDPEEEDRGVKIVNEPPETPNYEKDKTVAGEKRDEPYEKKDNNPPEECSDRPRNEEYGKKNDGASTVKKKYEQTLGNEASVQQYRKGGTQCDMPDIENEKIRDVMEKIRIFEEKVDKVRKIKFIKKY